MTTVDLQHLALARPLVVIDLESTGTDPAADRVVELVLVTLFPDRPADLFHTRLNPGVPIPPAATAVHLDQLIEVRAVRQRFRRRRGQCVPAQVEVLETGDARGAAEQFDASVGDSRAVEDEHFIPMR